MMIKPAQTKASGSGRIRLRPTVSGSGRIRLRLTVSGSGRIRLRPTVCPLDHDNPCKFPFLAIYFIIEKLFAKTCTKSLLPI